MQEKSLIKKNILQFIDKMKITKYEFYKQTGVTRGVLDQNNGMSEDNTAKFLARFPEINSEWLLTGKGEMLKVEDNSINQSGSNNVQHVSGSSTYSKCNNGHIETLHYNELSREEVELLLGHLREKENQTNTLLEENKKLLDINFKLRDRIDTLTDQLIAALKK